MENRTKKLGCLIVMLFLMLATWGCLTTRADHTKPLEVPIVNAEYGYSYQSPIDPASFIEWEVVSLAHMSPHPFLGRVVDVYAKNKDASAPFQYVNYALTQRIGILAYCLVDQNMCLHLYRLDTEKNCYTHRPDDPYLNDFKEDIEEAFGIKCVSPQSL